MDLFKRLDLSQVIEVYRQFSFMHPRSFVAKTDRLVALVEGLDSPGIVDRPGPPMNPFRARGFRRAAWSP